AHKKLDPIHFEVAKSVARDCEVIRADGQSGDAVNPARPGSDDSLETRLSRDCLDPRIGNDGSSRVGDCSIEVGPVDLCVDDDGNRQDEERCEGYPAAGYHDAPPPGFTSWL